MSLHPNHIPGIYNYCDRWCERCSFTSRCAVYENEQTNSPEENDISNKAFWDKLTDSMANAFSLLQKAADEHGFVFPEEDEETKKAYSANQDRLREELYQHPLIQLCKKYITAARALLQKNEAFSSRGQTLLQLVELGVKDIEETKNEAIELNDYLEIVQWYLFQIQVKFMRALPMEDEEPEEEEDLNSDSNGSAKVALIAADRCMMAWQKIMHLLPELENDIIPLLGMLQKIRSLGEQTFPNARAFVRPGFDE